MSSQAQSRRVDWACAGAWIVATLAFALARTPYDDEWFSIELLATDAAHFWSALADDLHPPWIALMDRAFFFGPRWPLQVVRVGAAGLGIAVLARVIRERTAQPAWLVWLAAFHPIVLMYAGAFRWYPFLLLGQALRVLAILSPTLPARAVAPVFAAGALIGAASGYLDVPFFLHDCAWLVLLHWRARPRVVFLAIFAGLLAHGLLRALSPLGAMHGVGLAAIKPSLKNLVVWSVLGAIGEAGPSGPWVALGGSVVIAIGIGLALLLRNASSRVLGLYIGSTALAWAATTTMRVWHPRYSLIVWLMAAFVVLFALRTAHARWQRAVAGVALAYLAGALALTLSGRGFYKADLNELSEADCSAVQGRPELLIVTYPRLASLLTARCQPSAEILTIPLFRIAREENEQLARLRARIVGLRDVWTMHVIASFSPTLTELRVRTLLAAHCVLRDRERFGRVPHLLLKRRLEPGAPPERFVRERWACAVD